MKIDKKDRSALKGYFVKNAIPTESNFAALIDAMLNQADDGIVKPAGNPLCIEASGDNTSFKKAINFYDSFSEENPAWVVSLNPRDKPADPSSASPGLSFDNAAGSSLLFIGRTAGNVGIGTCKPTAKLDVRGAIAAGNSDIYFTNAKHAHTTIGNAKGHAAIENAEDFDALMILGRAGTDKGRKVRVWDWLEVNGNLEVTGQLGVGYKDPSYKLHLGGGGQIGLENQVQTDSKAGIYWHTNDAYAIYRSPGAWTSPDYQQLTLQWHTGIVLRPGTGKNAGYQKSYVEITGGKGLRISEGTLGITGGTGGGYTLGGTNRCLEGGNEAGNLHIEGTNNLYLNHYTQKPIYLGSSDIYFTDTDHTHTGIGNRAGYAAIENAKNYDALMILGRAGTDMGRKVKLWDYLEVNGRLAVRGGGGTYEDNAFRVATNTGYGTFGSLNAEWFHMHTDRAKFYFNKPAHANGGFHTYSTRTVKKDIRYLSKEDERDVLQSLSDLRVVRFRYKDSGLSDRLHIGLIAEEAPEEIVSGGGISINLSDYVSFGVTALKALHRELQELKDRIRDLESSAGSPQLTG